MIKKEEEKQRIKKKWKNGGIANGGTLAQPVCETLPELEIGFYSVVVVMLWMYVCSWEAAIVILL